MYVMASVQRTARLAARRRLRLRLAGGRGGPGYACAALCRSGAHLAVEADHDGHRDAADQGGHDDPLDQGHAVLFGTEAGEEVTNLVHVVVSRGFEVTRRH